jgi:hypothetical protein
LGDTTTEKGKDKKAAAENSLGWKRRTYKNETKGKGEGEGEKRAK